MPLNINGNLGITAKNNIFTPKTSDIVTGNELTNVAKEILSASPAMASPGGPSACGGFYPVAAPTSP